MLPFSLSEREIEPGRHEIRVEGELDLSVADQLQEAIGRRRDEETLIDLTDCEFIDARGIAIIIRAQIDRAEAGGGRLVVHSPRDQVLRVLAIIGPIGRGLVFEGRAEALGEAAPVM
jgi:anti-anti-sigma factor